MPEFKFWNIDELRSEILSFIQDEEIRRLQIERGSLKHVSLLEIYEKLSEKYEPLIQHQCRIKSKGNPHLSQFIYIITFKKLFEDIVEALLYLSENGILEALVSDRKVKELSEIKSSNISETITQMNKRFFKLTETARQELNTRK